MKMFLTFKSCPLRRTLKEQQQQQQQKTLQKIQNQRSFQTRGLEMTCLVQ